jgi:radical SAM protein with 4Fe4S-binding SPASM domain
LLKEQLEILSYLDRKKLANIIRLRFSYYKSKFSKKVQHDGKPFSISIEPTTACNLGCPECPSGLKKFSRPTGKLNLEMNKKIIDQLKDELLYITYYFQGEPFLNKDFLEMIRYANQQKIYTATSTNAHYLTEKACDEIIDSGLNKVIISLDGLDQKTYESYRKGGDLSKVLGGLDTLYKKVEDTGKGPHIVIQFIVFKSNEHQLDLLQELGKKYPKIEVKIKSAQFYEFEDGNELMPSEEKYSRYKKVNGRFQINNELTNSCWRLWSSCVFTWDGKLVPCCFDKDAQHIMGDLQKESFNQMWTDNRLDDFRKMVFTDRSQIEICKNCSEGSKVWM